MKKTYLEPTMVILNQVVDIITASANDGGILYQNRGDGDQRRWIG